MAVFGKQFPLTLNERIAIDAKSLDLMKTYAIKV